MGYWDRALNDLVALGINLTGEQEHLLTEGGEGLVLKVLPDPTHNQCCEQPYLDVNGELALYAAGMDVLKPDAPLLGDEGRTAIEVADGYWAEDWSRWPSVLGEQENVLEGWGGGWGDDMSVARIWAVMPADEPTIRRFRVAANKWLNDTDYGLLDYVMGVEASGIDVGEEPCEVPCRLHEDLDDCVDEETDDGEPYFWAAVHELKRKGWLTTQGIRDLPPIQPFEQFLDDPGDVALYQALKRRSRQATLNALQGILPAARGAYMRHEGYFEPWY